ncbi:venom peptide Pc-like [Haematobia irritans]|uniref:venom peptide Pc-like n=1 Tax=Haematobia irritans TaxID=7368 RepID=UPI003F4F54AD
MKFCAFLILIIAFIALGSAEITCRIDGKTIKVGQTHQPGGQCRLYTCTNEGVFHITECKPLKAIGKNDKVIEKDITKPFPDCCARVVS